MCVFVTRLCVYVWLQGYNNVIIYSRSFYFCLVSLLIILLDVWVSRFQGSTFSLYGVNIVSVQLLEYSRDLMKGQSIRCNT